MNGPDGAGDASGSTGGIERARQVLRIARWEVTSGAVGLDRRVAALVLLVVLGVGAVGVAVTTAGTAQDTGIYRVGLEESSEYYPAVANDNRLRAVDRNRTHPGEYEASIREGVVRAKDTEVGRAAASAVRDAVERYNEQLMQEEAATGNATAAFPVRVELRYVDRNRLPGVDPVATSTPDRRTTAPGDGTGSESDPQGTETASANTPTDAETPADGDTADAGPSLPALDPETILGGSGTRPTDIQPPFPFASLVLAFLFVVPMNFVVQVYGSSVLRERTNRRGELLLTAPVTPGTIVAGKTLPYFAVMVGIAATTALALGGGVVSIGAVLPVALVFLAATLLSALFARSHKELTFLLVTVSVLVTSFVFVPAIFSDIHPIAAISPLTMVVRDLEGGAVGAEQFLFATVPMTLAAAVLFYLGGGLYREEDLFAQRPVPEKILDALARPLGSRRSVGLLTAALVPFVILAELLAVAVVFVLPPASSLVLLFGLIAIIEEVGKSIHVLAGFERDRFERTGRRAVAVGVASGIGFFLAEKLAVATQFVGLSRLAEGRVVFDLLAGTGGPETPLALAGVLLAPLLLHSLTAVISALGAMRSRSSYLLGLTGAAFVHLLYNLTVVSLVVG